MQVLAFQTMGESYCCELPCVLRVIKVVALQAMPGMPAYCKGFMDYCGQQIPVMDLAESLDKGNRVNYTLETPVILIQHADTILGLIVEEVLGVETVSDVDMSALPTVEADQMLQKSVYIGNTPAFFLDIAHYVGKFVSGGVSESAR